MTEPAPSPHPDPPRHDERPIRLRYLLTIFAWAVALLLFLRFFNAAKTILLGFLAAACVAAALRPLVRRMPGPRSLVGTLVGLVPMVVAGGLIFLLAWLLTEPIARQFRQWPQIQQNINTLLQRWSQRLGLDDPVTVQGLLQQLVEFLTGASGPQVVSITASLLSGLLIALAFVFIGCIYLLAEPPGRLLNPVLNILPPHRRPQLQNAIDDLMPKLRWWLIGTLISMSVIGLVSWIGYTLIGLNMALPLAILAGLAEIVPTVGPLVAFLVALMLGLTQGPATAAGVAGLWVVVQTLESYVLLPLVMREAVSIPPVVTLFTVVLWGAVFGAPGLLLAIPIDLVIWTFADHFLIRPQQRPEPT